MSGLLPPGLADCAKPWRTTRRLAIGAGILASLSTVGLLSLSGWFITAAAIAGSAGPLVARTFNYLVPSALIRLFAIFRTLGRYAERLLSHRASLSTLAAVRTRLFCNAAAAEAQGTLRLSGGEAAALLGEDVDQLEDRLVRGPAIAGAVAAAASAIALGALAGSAPAIGIALILGLAIWATRVLARHLLPERSKSAASALTDLKVALTENVAAAGEIAVYGLTERVAAELARTASREEEAASRLARAEAAVAAVVPAAAGLASAFAVATASTGAALAAMAALAAAAAGEGLVGLTRSEIRAPSIEAALNRLHSLASVGEGGAVTATAARPSLLIGTNVGEYRLPPGARAALVGRSGTGKTRLLETLAGLRSDAPQQLLVDGQAAAAIALYGLRPAFALVPQNPMLIAGTILDNLRIARPGITETEIWEALATACLDEEVRALADGLEQWIGEAGLELSGGQRKRLALARGLLARRPWLLLDEPSEGLDSATEARLAASLNRWLEESGSGLLLVTHRPTLRTLCDTIIEL